MGPPLDAGTMGNATHSGRDLDRYLFGRIVSLCLADQNRPPNEILGLTSADLRRLVQRHVPHFASAVAARRGSEGTGTEALEEPDYRAYLLEHRAQRCEQDETWLAAIIARRSLAPNHLWQDLGLQSRKDLNALLSRHFPALVRLNRSDMKWKKFIYRQLCERDGVLVCKAPNCAACSDFFVCFGSETGEPLDVLADVARGVG